MESTVIDFCAYERGVHYRHDKGYKDLLSSKRAFLELLRAFVKKDWVSQIDESSLIRTDNSYILQDFESKTADIVYRAKLGHDEIVFYVLIALQSTVDFLMPFRLGSFMYEIWRDIFRNTPKNIRRRKSFKFPPIVPIVLYNGTDRWGASQSFAGMVNRYECFREYIPDFEYILIDVNRYDEGELLRMGNLIGTVFYLDQKKDLEELIAALSKVVSTLRTLHPNDLESFKSWAKGVICRGLPLEKQVEISSIMDEVKEVEDMISNVTIAIRRGYNEARREGEERGEKRGEKRGEERGRAATKREIVENWLRLHPDVDNETVSQVVGLPVEEVAKMREKILN